MKNRWIIIPITLLCLGTQASVDAADVSQPFAHQELQNQAKEIAKWKADRESLPRIKIEKQMVRKRCPVAPFHQLLFMCKKSR